MKTTIRAAAAVVTLFAASAAQAQQAVQWKVSDGGNGHWYQGILTSPQGSSWSVARAIATARGADLACVRNANEAEWLFASIVKDPSLWSGSAGPWVGGLQTLGSAEPAGGWVWVDGTSVHPTVWSAGQPDNATVCGGDNNRIGYWNAQQGSPRPFLEDSPDSAFIECPPSLLGRRVGAVIEWSADCNNDGIVDKGQILQGQLVDANANGVPDVCEVDPAQQAVQWRVSDGGNDHWYRLVVSGPITWPEARAASEGIGGHLATPTSAAENAFVLTISNRAANPLAWVDDFGGNSGGPWIGGYQPVNASSTQPWAWVSGEPWAWTGWAPGEPNGGFGPGLSVTGLLGYAGSSAIRGWSDAGLTDFPPYPLPPSYVVEWSADCNGDGIVDYGQILQGQLVDADANGVPDVCEVDPCPGDITNGGTVDAADLSILLAAWGTNGQAEFDTDIDGSGLVDGGDLALVLGGWGPCPQ